mmetsp:Transcript_12129/g.14104  ORF Transcript_12129/g.14104 Transcript_12129/m.14104 type:complete len:89 (-) Transcript_12129:733-999(-)
MMDSSSSLFDTLVENAKYMPAPQDSESKEPSGCEVHCQTEQKSLVSCINTLRDKNAEDDNDVKSSENQCLPSAVATWTQCCTEANSRT